MIAARKTSARLPYARSFSLNYSNSIQDHSHLPDPIQSPIKIDHYLAMRVPDEFEDNPLDFSKHHKKHFRSLSSRPGLIRHELVVSAGQAHVLDDGPHIQWKAIQHWSGIKEQSLFTITSLYSYFRGRAAERGIAIALTDAIGYRSSPNECS